MKDHPKKPIGSILLKRRLVSAKELEAAMERNEAAGGITQLVAQLTAEGLLDETQALQALSEQSGCPGIDLNLLCIRIADANEVPRDVRESELVLPVLSKGERLFVAMANPDDDQLLAELELITKKRIFPYIALEAVIRRVLVEIRERESAGRRHWIGPGCPHETIAKAGATMPPPTVLPSPPPPTEGEEFALDEDEAEMDADFLDPHHATVHPPPVVAELSAEGERYLELALAAYRAGDVAAAVDHLRAGIAANPGSYELHCQLGLLYGRQGQTYEAIEEMEAALALHPEYFPALKNLAVLYLGAGFRARAVEIWQRCLRLAPDEATRETIKRHLVAAS